MLARRSLPLPCFRTFIGFERCTQFELANDVRKAAVTEDDNLLLCALKIKFIWI